MAKFNSVTQQVCCPDEMPSNYLVSNLFRMIRLLCEPEFVNHLHLQSVYHRQLVRMVLQSSGACQTLGH